MTAAVATDLSTGTWAIDPVHSSISFSVRHLVVSKVRGNFEAFSGAVVVAEDGTPSVSAEISSRKSALRPVKQAAEFQSKFTPFATRYIQIAPPQTCYFFRT